MKRLTWKKTFAVFALSIVLALAIGWVVFVWKPIPTKAGDPSSSPTAEPTPRMTLHVDVGQDIIPDQNLPPAPAAQPAACDRIPDTWLPYTIQPGDRLVYLAAPYGLTSDQLAYYNCLPDKNRIIAGRTLWLPRSADDVAALGLAANPTSESATTKIAAQSEQRVFENSLVWITCRYPQMDQAGSLTTCPRPAVDMFTVARQYSQGWVFYFPALNQFYVQLADGTPIPPFDETHLSADPFEMVAPEDTLERFVQAENLGDRLGTPLDAPVSYLGTVQWTADRQGFTITLPHWPVNPITAALAN